MAESKRSVISILGGSRASGRWRVPSRTSIFAVLGRTVIDLREAESEADQITITCFSVLARVTILVPDGADVQPSGMAILGSSTCQVPPSNAVSPLPSLSIDATTVLGKLSIQVRTDAEAGIVRARWWQRSRRRAPGDAPGETAGRPASLAAAIPVVPSSFDPAELEEVGDRS